MSGVLMVLTISVTKRQQLLESRQCGGLAVVDRSDRREEYSRVRVQ